MQLALFGNKPKPQIELADLFAAYYACRKNKRKTVNALAFELDFESKLIALRCLKLKTSNQYPTDFQSVRLLSRKPRCNRE